MDISGCHQNGIFVFLDIHDPLERMCQAGALLFMADQTQNLWPMELEKWSAQVKETCREVIVDSMAGRADLGVSTVGYFLPSPAAILKNRFALRADGRGRQFALGLVGVVHIFLKQAVMADRVKSLGQAGAFQGDLPFSIKWPDWWISGKVLTQFLG